MELCLRPAGMQGFMDELGMEGWRLSRLWGPQRGSLGPSSCSLSPSSGPSSIPWRGQFQSHARRGQFPLCHSEVPCVSFLPLSIPVSPVGIPGEVQSWPGFPSTRSHFFPAQPRKLWCCQVPLGTREHPRSSRIFSRISSSFSRRAQHIPPALATPPSMAPSAKLVPQGLLYWATSPW